MLITIPAVAVAVAEPRASYSFIWPVLIGSIAWPTVAIFGSKYAKWSLTAGIMLTAIPFVVFIAPVLPGVVMSDGMKSLNILAGVEVALLAAILPTLDCMLVRTAVK